MRDDVRRRAAFGLTIENFTTRVWFNCRSSIVVSRKFDFMDVHNFFFFGLWNVFLICCVGTKLGA